MEELMEILRELRPDVDFEKEDALINELMDVFDVEISMADLEPENFNSAQAIYDFVMSLKK